MFYSFSRVSEATLESFFGAILGVVRPSGPWCFPVRQGSAAVAAAPAAAAAAAANFWQRFSVLFLDFLFILFLRFQKQR